MSKPNGGYAYPSRGHVYTDKYGDTHEGPGPSGMTLRDYFAGQALAGLAPGIIEEMTNIYTTPADTIRGINALPGIAYMMADAMLKARQS